MDLEWNVDVRVELSQCCCIWKKQQSNIAWATSLQFLWLSHGRCLQNLWLNLRRKAVQLLCNVSCWALQEKVLIQILQVHDWAQKIRRLDNWNDQCHLNFTHWIVQEFILIKCYCKSYLKKYCQKLQQSYYFLVFTPVIADNGCGSHFITLWNLKRPNLNRMWSRYTLIKNYQMPWLQASTWKSLIFTCSLTLQTECVR